MHMNPSSHGCGRHSQRRRVAEGEKIGVVSNYLDFPNGTRYHLHFDVQVFTRDGWLWVNPYTTLIASYERLIRGRGREIGTDPPPPPRWRTRCRRTCFATPTPGKAARTDRVVTKPPRPRPSCRAGGVQRKAAPNRFQTLIEATADVR